jgi:hypothetical protein
VPVEQCAEADETQLHEEERRFIVFAFRSLAQCYADVLDAPRVHHKVTSRSYGIHG